MDTVKKEKQFGTECEKENSVSEINEKTMLKKCKLEKQEHSQSDAKSLHEQPVHLQVRYKLKKANGYKPDLSYKPIFQ